MSRHRKQYNGPQEVALEAVCTVNGITHYGGIDAAVYAASTLGGLRVGELLGLKWEDVDFERNVIHVRRSIVKQRIGPPKSEASQKPIPLNTKAQSKVVEMIMPGIRKAAR